MLIAKNIRAFSFNSDEISLTWEIADTNEDLSTYTVAVMRSQAVTGPYDVVSSEMNAADVSEFHDRGVNQLSFWREYFYRIRITQAGSGDTWTWGSNDPKAVMQGETPGGVTMEALPDLEALEAIRRLDMLLQEYAAREVLHLRARSWGQRCRECWDPVKRRVSKSDCLACFSTGFTGGYYPPTRVRCMKPSSQMLVALTSLFEMQPKDIARIFSPRARLAPRDLIIDTEMTRWRVLNLERSEKGGALTRITAQCRAITRDQVEYRIPVVGWNADTFSVAPPRQYIRATDIESFHKAARELGIQGTGNRIMGMNEQES